MPAPLNNQRNDFLHNPKRSDIYTPAPLAQFLFDLLSKQDFAAILDPAIGAGALTDPWRASGRTILGCDIDPASEDYADVFLPGPFEEIKDWPAPKPDLAICNAPFNAAKANGLYPEVFLRHLVGLFGPALPIALFSPMGLRLNQRRRSSRWRWLRDSGPQINDIIALPLDIFPGVEFHTELILFNLPNIEHHRFLPQRYMNLMLQDEVHVNLKTGRYYLAEQKLAQGLKHARVMTEAAAMDSGYRYAYER